MSKIYCEIFLPVNTVCGMVKKNTENVFYVRRETKRKEKKYGKMA